MKKNKKGIVSRPLMVFVGLFALAFTVSTIFAATVSRKTDSSGTQIYLLEDSGNLTVAGSLTSGTGQTITSGGLTVTAGGATITAGGLEVTAGGANITAGGLEVNAGGANVTGGVTVATGGLTVTAGGATVTAGGLTVTSGIVNLGSWSETLAEAAVITNQAGLGILTGTSGGTTNTIANPAVLGDTLKLVNISANPIVLIEDTNLQIAGNITLGQWDSIELIAATTTNWVEAGRSDN